MVGLAKTRGTKTDSGASKQAGRFAQILKRQIEDDRDDSAGSSDAVAEELAQSERQEVPIAIVHRRPSQVRRYFDPFKLELLAQQIKRDGIRTALWVRPSPDHPGEYQLMAGERRYRCAQTLGLKTVPVIVFDLNDEEMLEASLVENMQREDLNPFEETEGILELLELRLKKTRAEVVAIFNRKKNEAKNRDSQSRNSAVPAEEWQTIEEVFATIGRITPDAFRSHRLPLLNLPSEVLEALRQGKLEYTKARAIATVKDPEKREWLLEKAIDENLTLRQIQAEAREANQTQSADSDIKSQIQSLGKRINQSGILDNPNKRAKLEKFLAQINQLIDS